MSNQTTVTAEAGSPIITIERIFDAPREKVFRVFSDAALVARWWSPNGTATVEALDFREGGRWHFSGTGDQTISFHGFFHEITAPERFVQTSEFDNLEAMIGERGHTVLAKYEFLPTEDGRTRLVTTEMYMSTEDRDMAVQSDMESGVVRAYQSVDSILKGME